QLRSHVNEITRLSLWRRTWVLLEKERLGALGEHRIVRMVPVRERVVEAHAKSLGSNSFDELSGDVSAVLRVLEREVGGLRVEHRIAGVVPGREHDVSRAGRPRQPGYRRGIPPGSISGGRRAGELRHLH